MANVSECYDFIRSKIDYLKENYQSLRQKTEDYAFSALCVKSDFYKNPALDFNDSVIDNMMVDGANDGGVDAMLSDPNSDEANLVLIQSKFHQKISFEEVVNAITKMVRFYNNMKEGNYADVQDKVVKRFLNLDADVGEESKVVFVLYISAPRNGIRSSRYENAFKALTKDPNKFVLHVLFDEDIRETIKEAESRRPDVESGKLYIDCSDNYLAYGDDEAIIVNASAFCIKELYGIHALTLLSKNLRYHVAGANIDKAIRASIQTSPDDFWFKNNGITIICDDFKVSGTEVKLKHFSIVNGGQTTYNLYKSRDLNKDNDFYLPCKIIKIRGASEDEKSNFVLEIAKATNSQKAIKQIDLKANSPEQVRFANTMREAGIFYQTKRGEVVPKEYKEDYKNTDLAEVGKLCLSAIFQLPGTSRNKPSALYNPEYYEIIFNGNQPKIAKLAKQLLYMDSYFKNSFLDKFDKNNELNPNASELIPLAHNARTTCIAFTAFASRYYYGNINAAKLKDIFDHSGDDSYSNFLYDIFKDIDSISTFFPDDLYQNKDKFDNVLYKIYDAIIKSGRKVYSSEHKHDSSLNESNFLKKDSNYYSILKIEWDDLSEKIQSIFDTITK